MRIVVSHPRRKKKSAPRVGHPANAGPSTPFPFALLRVRSLRMTELWKDDGYYFLTFSSTRAAWSMALA